MENGCALTDEDIHKALAGTSLAEYMVPDTYMRLDAMPMTPNLKINRKALPTPEIKRANDYVAPEGETETLFTQIFSQVLNIEQVGATDDFFEIGGTSINAIKVIVEASKHGVQIVFNDLFNLKTPKALAEYVSGNTKTQGAVAPSVPTSQPSPMDNSEYAAFIPVLDKNVLNTFRDGERQPVGDVLQPVGDVLLTGATGYLGIHILHELLTNYDGHILCPLRCEPGSDPMVRLKTLYYYYFGKTEVFDHFEERVEAFTAEITEPDALKGIDKRGLTVINCVANVKHFSRQTALPASASTMSPGLRSDCRSRASTLGRTLMPTSTSIRSSRPRNWCSTPLPTTV